jgi:hypothetical protein
MSIRYEDLCEDPETIVVGILQFLGLEQKANPGYEALIEARAVELLDEVRRKRASISNRLADYFAHCEYDLGLD